MKDEMTAHEKVGEKDHRVFWTLAHSPFHGTESSKIHATRDGKRTLCNIAIGDYATFTKQPLECIRCSKKTGSAEVTQ